LQLDFTSTRINEPEGVTMKSDPESGVGAICLVQRSSPVATATMRRVFQAERGA
jgi:hypothetical protein